MLVYSASVKVYEKPMALLVDSGASQNFVSKAALRKSLSQWDPLTREGKRENMLVRLAGDSTARSDGALGTANDHACVPSKTAVADHPAPRTRTVAASLAEESAEAA
ncbi:hypothetical protein PybrP1_006424 [[Pythium] brassicae (nom. inval.)]|nr:hypothetical protein PybrP1_006424 [[Pythium] brassicae (nom. inval.)]